MNSKMQAAVVERFGDHPVLQEWSIPEPGPGRILVRTEASGVCHIMANCITIRGSIVGTRQDMTEALAFAADGRVKADIERQPLSAINDVLTRLERGQVASRVVIDFEGM